MNCGNEMKMKKWSSQWTQFIQLRKGAWKKNSGLQRGLNPWPRDTGAMLYQLSYEATDVGSRSIVGSYVPVKEVSVNDIWNNSYIAAVIARTRVQTPLKSWIFFQASLRNCINCVHCDDHFFIFIINYSFRSTFGMAMYDYTLKTKESWIWGSRLKLNHNDHPNTHSLREYSRSHPSKWELNWASWVSLQFPPDS